MSEFFTLNEKDLEKNKKIREEYRSSTKKYETEERDILIVTDANDFSASASPNDTLWSSSIGLTAWTEEGSQEIYQGKFRLKAIASDKLYKYLRANVRHDSIYKCRVRLSEDRDFLLLNIPEPVFDSRLDIILKEQQKTVTLFVEGIGTFRLDRCSNRFEKEVDWVGTSVWISFEQEEEDPSKMEKDQEVIRMLMENRKEWDQRIRSCAADELLDTANVWAEDAEEPSITREQFMARMELGSIYVDDKGEFEFWFGDDDMFWGHDILVTGNIEEGPTWSDMIG